jgi:hypothetical protein
MRIAFALSLALLVPVAACAADGGKVHAPPAENDGRAGERSRHDRLPVVRYDEPFPLTFSRSAKVEHSSTRVRFVAVPEDSRCPTGVQCVQAGRARVRLEVTNGRTAPVWIELGTNPETSLASAGGVTWELQAVEPYPAAGRERRPADYVLTLVAHPLRGR